MKATLSFVSNLPIFQHEKPYELWIPPDAIPEGMPWTNCKFAEHPDIEIKDVRSSNIDFGYETTGFKYLSSPLNQSFVGDFNWRLDDDLVQEYIKDTVELVQREFSAHKVLCFDWRVSQVIYLLRSTKACFRV